VSLAPLTLGTAGHIDHGKSALIRALTGTDTDRLPEEHERGISIELGYARLELPGGRGLSVVDVPGHERFVRTMVAGATGIDLFLLCVAADDGVMPQTREHLAVLRHLGVTRGVAAVTKSDLADPALAAAEVADLLPGTAVVAVSARAQTGLHDLLVALEQVAAELPGRGRAGPEDLPRLHVDRSFSLRGIGTVVTGTLWSGSLAVGDRAELLPAGRTARVRSIEVHDERVARADAGQRVALNLAGVARDEVVRGDVITSPGGKLAATYRIDATVELEPSVRRLRRGARVHVHHGTRETPARVAPLDGEVVTPGASTLVQLRLEAPLVPAAGDRFVLRQVAPPDTIGGGEVLDPQPRRHGRRPDPRPTPPGPAPAERVPPALDAAALGLADLLREAGASPPADGDLAAAAGLEPREAARALRALEETGRAVRVGRNLHFDPHVLVGLTARVAAVCERDGSATIAGVRDELGTSRRYAQALLEHLDRERVTIRRGDVHVLRARVSRP
jgi:selenocysteine-specific elongation factor